VQAVRTKANEMVRYPVLLDQRLDARDDLLVDEAIERVHHALRHLVAVVGAGIQGLCLDWSRRVFLAACL